MWGIVGSEFYYNMERVFVNFHKTCTNNCVITFCIWHRNLDHFKFMISIMTSQFLKLGEKNKFELKIHTVTNFDLSNTIGIWFTSFVPFDLSWNNDWEVDATISKVWERITLKTFPPFNSYFNFDPFPIIVHTRICTILDQFLDNDDTIGYRVSNIYKTCKQLFKRYELQKQLLTPSSYGYWF